MNRIVGVLALIALVFVLASCGGPQLVFTATMTPGAEEAPPILNGATPSGAATATLSADESTLTVTGTFEGLTGPATAAHIHGPAEPGVSAGVVFPLTVTAATSGTVSGTWSDITAEQVADLRAGLYYVNIHTGTNGAGEIRGQLE